MADDKTTARKILIIDTSVLLYDKSSIRSFPGCDVIIPLDVLDELDRANGKMGLVGENARDINRYLDGLRDVGDLNQGVMIPDDGGQTIKVLPTSGRAVPEGLDNTEVDNRIIGLATTLKGKTADSVKVVTKDINFRVKCDALGIPAIDYYKDNLKEDSKLYSGVCERKVSSDIIDQIFDGEVVQTNFRVNPNEFVVLKSSTDPNHSALTINRPSGLCKVGFKMHSSVEVKPLNKEQMFALTLLMDMDIPLVTMTGIAGSGKTFLALMSGMSGLTDENYKRIVITRPIVPVGRDLGYLPGDVNEKMAPWLSPIMDNFRDGLADFDGTWFEQMKQRRKIEVAPLSYMRGRTFNDSYIIVDEAQNATIHELKTLVTRVGKGSKIVLLGDIDQVDTPYIDTLSNGLSITVERFRSHSLSGHIQLPRGARSDLATLASRIL